MLTPSATVCIVGFGAAGSALAAGLAQRGFAVRAWDLLLEDPAHRDVMRSRIEAALVDPAPSLADAMRGAKLVICADAASAENVRRQVSAMLVAGQAMMDLGSTSPATQTATLGFAYDPAMRQASSRGELP